MFIYCVYVRGLLGDHNGALALRTHCTSSGVCFIANAKQRNSGK